MKLRTPSPALVISIISLCVALGGSAYAATQITSKQIKNGTIQNIDVKKGTLQSSSFSAGVQNLLKAKSGNTASSTAGGHVAYEAVAVRGGRLQRVPLVL